MRGWWARDEPETFQMERSAVIVIEITVRLTCIIKYYIQTEEYWEGKLIFRLGPNDGDYLNSILKCLYVICG
jgi:hypothetical protein